MKSYLEKLLSLEGMTTGEIESIIEAVESGDLSVDCIKSQMLESVKKLEATQKQ